MKKLILCSFVGVLVMLLANIPIDARAMDNGMMDGVGYRGYDMGPGMMHGYGGYGMMGPGQGAEGYYPCGFWGTDEPGTGKKLTKDSVKDFLHDRIEYNPNLKIGKITEKDKYFIAEIVTKDNSIVEKLQIDKETGSIRPVY